MVDNHIGDEIGNTPQCGVIASMHAQMQPEQPHKTASKAYYSLASELPWLGIVIIMY